MLILFVVAVLFYFDNLLDLLIFGFDRIVPKLLKITLKKITYTDTHIRRSHEMRKRLDFFFVKHTKRTMKSTDNTMSNRKNGKTKGRITNCKHVLSAHSSVALTIQPPFGFFYDVFFSLNLPVHLLIFFSFTCKHCLRAHYLF